MAQVKAGVAYVDVRLGSVEQFKNKLKVEVEKAARESAKKLGDEIAKQAAPAGQKVGKQMGETMAREWLRTSSSSMTAGFRALATGQISVFSRLMKDAGLAGGLALQDGLRAGVSKADAAVRSAGARIVSAAKSAGIAAGKAFDALPGKIASAGVALDGFSKRLGFLAFQLTNFGFIAATAFTAPAAALLGLGTVIGVKTAARIEQAMVSLRSMLGAGYDVEALIKRLQAMAEASPIFNSADLVEFAQKMTASGMAISKTEAFLKSFGNIALQAGADVSKIPFALEALVQMVGKGKVSMEELRLQLGDALPGAMDIVSIALGVTTGELYEMVEAGELTGKELVEAFTKLGQTKKYLDGAAAGAETMQSKWQELKESLQNQLGQIFLDNAGQIKKAIEDLGPALSNLVKNSEPALLGIIKGFADFAKRLGELMSWYDSLSPTQQDMINKIILMAVALGPVVLILGTFGAAIAGITAGLAALATPAGGIALAIAGIGLAIFGVVQYFKNLYAEGGKFKESWDKIWAGAKKLVEPVIEDVKKLWQQIKEAFDQVKSSFDRSKGTWNTLFTFLKAVFVTVGAVIWGIIRGIIAALGPLLRAVGSLISGIVKFVGGFIDLLVGFFTLDFAKMWDALGAMWDGLWDAIVGTIKWAIKALIALVEGLVKGIVDFFHWLWDILVGHSIIPDTVNAIIDWFKKMLRNGVEIVKNLGKPFKEFYNNHIKPWLDDFKKGFDKVVAWVKELPGKIKSVFKDAGSWLLQAGKDIVNGLVDGVKKMAGVLKRAILALIPAPVRGIVEKALGIESPSKVFAEYGKFVVLGFISGIESAVPALLDVVYAKFGNLTPAKVSGGFYSPSEVETGSRSYGSVLNIENYHGGERDPRRVAEDLWFVLNSRGGV